MKKQSLLVYETPEGTLGYRPNRFDREVGDRLNTADGSERSVVVKVVEDTQDNRRALSEILKVVARYTKGVAVTKKQSIQMGGITLSGRMEVGRKKWISAESRREYFLKSIKSI